MTTIRRLTIAVLAAVVIASSLLSSVHPQPTQAASTSRLRRSISIPMMVAIAGMVGILICYGWVGWHRHAPLDGSIPSDMTFVAYSVLFLALVISSIAMLWMALALWVWLDRPRPTTNSNTPQNEN